MSRAAQQPLIVDRVLYAAHDGLTFAAWWDDQPYAVSPGAKPTGGRPPDVWHRSASHRLAHVIEDLQRARIIPRENVRVVQIQNCWAAHGCELARRATVRKRVAIAEPGLFKVER